MKKKIVVIGAGAAGLMAAIAAAEDGGEVILLEKMPTVGKKILITGKGRCNVTNVCDIQELIKNMPGNGSFLHSAFRAFDNQQIRDFLEQQDVPTKVERGGRVFPESDKAIDVVNAFLRAARELQVKILTNHAVKEITVQDNTVVGVVTKQNNQYPADAVILATGGSSYPGTGSAGEGYSMAEKIGHTIVPLRPSLVPLEVEEDWIKELQGLSLRNVSASVVCGDKKVEDEFGEMLFTHYGLSGPIILSLSNKVANLLNTNAGEVIVEINLKPALSEETLDKRIQRDFEKFQRKQIKNALGELLPARLIPIIMDLAYLDPEKPVNQISKTERSRLLQTITHLPLTISRTRPISEAIVTAGGVHTKEINPKTMESKLIRGLYLAGEVIDIDGYTGGYNLQAAFSTGYVAGKSAAQEGDC